jgi:hypothetical protein
MSTGRVAGWLTLTLGLAAVTGAAKDVPSVRIPRVTRPPTLEDFQSGTPREAEAVVTDFRQQRPGNGTPVSQPTTAYLSYDDRNLYVGFVCQDDPKRVRATLTKREDFGGDDYVSINVDTFHDHRRTYFFDVNPMGVQQDGLYTEGQGGDLSFETLWYSEARLTPDGYVALITIPFRSLRFPDTPQQFWGIALARVIQRNNELSYWPFLEQDKPLVVQFGHLEGLEGISPGRNLQVIPYAVLSGARFLDQPEAHAPSFATDNESAVGLDGKAVFRDALTLDLTVNPDFSQVESDDPQVTVNQRYEVYFPEKRPFFLENADFFQTPETLFFSRRIVDPRLGARLTGKLGGWSLGLIGVDDRAPLETGAGDDWAGIGVVRVQRELGRESHVGLFASTRDLGAAHNRVLSLDSRLRVGESWSIDAQVSASHTGEAAGPTSRGTALSASIVRSGRLFYGSLSYLDRSPDFRSDLGFIPRVDVRSVSPFVRYWWRPERGRVVQIGPSLSASGTWDHHGLVQNWDVSPSFRLELRPQTVLMVGHSQSFERYQEREFRTHGSWVSVSTSWLRWLSAHVFYGPETAINYYPPEGLAPQLASSDWRVVSLSLRATARLKLELEYTGWKMTTLEGSPAGRPADTPIFTNHLFRSRLNFQLNRELSLRAIVDYEAVLPDETLVSLERSKRFGLDLLLTYLLNPGTAVHLGYTNTLENLTLDPAHSPPVWRTDSPNLSTGRQVFLKVSYLWRM